MSGAGYGAIRLAVADGVAAITLDRPERLNAMNRQMIGEINAAIDSLAQSNIRVLLLRGAGRAFSSGADLLGELGEDAGEPLESLYNPLIERLAALPVPVVAAVQGPAAGAGCALALAADFVIAARSAYFLLAFVGVGLVPDAGTTWRLPRLVGVARAQAAMLLGERIAAEQAAAWGMIHEAVADGALEARVAALSARLARGPTRAYALIRRNLHAALGQTLSETLAAERAAQREAGETADFAEGVAAFREKRPADFHGG